MSKKIGFLLAAILTSGILSTQAGYCDDDYRYNQNFGPNQGWGGGYNNGYNNGYYNGYGNGNFGNPGPLYGNGNGLLSRFMRFNGGYPNNAYSGGYMNNGNNGWGRCQGHWGGYGRGRHGDGDGDRD